MTALENITTDLNWRYGELAFLKTIPFRYHMLENHIAQLKKYMIPAIYSIWEGFLCNTIMTYIKEINRACIMPEDMKTNVLTYVMDVDDRFRLTSARTQKEKREKFVQDFRLFLSHPVVINTKVITESNVNLKVTNNLLNSFGLEPLPNEEYNDRLNKFLKFRNAIAHGDNAIRVTDKNITDFTQLINDLMADIVIRVEDGIRKQSYKIENRDRTRVV